MPGFEIFGDEERKQVNEVLETGILMRYGFDGLRKDRWKAKEFETSFSKRMGAEHCQLVSSGTAALTVALASAGRSEKHTSELQSRPHLVCRLLLEKKKKKKKTKEEKTQNNR